MDNQNKNLILATVLSFLVIMVWFILFPPPEQVVNKDTVDKLPTSSQTPSAPVFSVDVGNVGAYLPRVSINSENLIGSIALLGGRIDTLSLKKYQNTVNNDSGMVRLFSPAGQENGYYAVFGWGPSGALDYNDVPGANTPWRVVGNDVLSPGNPVTLQWDNGKGLLFTNEISLDARYLFTITQRAENKSEAPAQLYPYGILARHGKPNNLENFFISHEGVVGLTDGKLSEVDYDDLTALPVIARESGNAEIADATQDGWIGFTDKYWMGILIPEQGKAFTSVMKFVPNAQIYQTEVRAQMRDLPAGASITHTVRLFAGAKEWGTLQSYMSGKSGVPPIPSFVDAIDWGWFFFLTKPIFHLLHWFNATIGNMGFAIIALTFTLKFLVLPLAYKSYVSMARMKELQPEMEALKQRAGDDKQMLQREMMKLYKEKKVNPAAGCLPVLLQIPIFFSLYKVIFVTIELRQAPFFGWLNDLSQPDPSSIFNLFGLLPWGVPAQSSILALVFIGVLPILLGITMWLQQKLNPAPSDPMQQQIFAWMPWIFMFMLGGFASGLVLYWIANNIITFVQQYAIMRSHGHKPDIFGNIRSSFVKKGGK